MKLKILITMSLLFCSSAFAQKEGSAQGGAPTEIGFDCDECTKNFKGGSVNDPVVTNGEKYKCLKGDVNCTGTNLPTGGKVEGADTKVGP